MKRSGVFRVGFFSAMLLLTLQAFSQVPGTNINMVSGTQFPAGDPYLQRQNEPSMAVSSRNPQHLLAGANDYRSVDIPFPPDSGMETGDAWLGVFTSLDGGQTWSSTLLPGFPQDQSTVGVNSPLHGFAAATDPTVRAGTHGLFYYSGLAFNRGNNAPSGVFVASFQDQNNKGNGAGAIQQQNKGTGSPFLYRNATLVDTGNSGQFLDKPWIAVDVPRPGTAAGTASCTDANGKAFISGNVYVFYTKFNGSNNNPSSAIEVVSSKNCGASWSKPVKISQSAQLNQGTVAAVDPGTGTVYVFWRQLGNGKQNQPDAILYASSSNGGSTWNTGTAYTFPAGSNFDESADSGTFREADLPAATVDGSGRVWLAVSQRNLGPLSTSRIIVTTMPRGGSQKSWTAPFIADNSQQPGHQFMPALSFAYGKLMLTWYDNREDHTKGVLTCSGNMNCTEARKPITGTLGAADSPSAIFAPAISDTGLHVRHTIDVRGELFDPTPFDNGGALALQSVRISQYPFGSRPCSDGSKTCSNPIEQLQFNPPNFPMFSHGTKPFIGDYIDVAALTMFFDPASGKWVFNTSPSNAAVFHATWTDNRDVRPPPVVSINGVPTQNWALYTAVGSTGGQSFYDPSQMKDVCVPGTNDNQTGSRNQNVYTARITQGLLVGVKENTKPLINGNNTPVQRAFSVFARNTTNTVADYRFTVNPLNPNQNLCTTDASGTTASFFQTIPPVPPFTCVNFVDVIAMPRSTVSRTLFVNSTLKYPSVSVTIAQIDQIGGMPNGMQSTTAINPDSTNPDITNPDITNPDITNPDITNPDITNPDIANAEVYDPTVTNPDITNPDITNPDITNPDITNPDITNPDITNPDINNLVVTNPDITNPDITNPDITNPDITNPDITNPDINSLPADGISDVTFKLNNKGNTSSSYSAKEFARQVGVQCCPAGCTGGAGCPASCSKCQLIARKIYATPIANACTLTVQAQNIPISNIPDPAFTTGGFTTPDNGSDSLNSQPDATVSLGPGEGARVTLRVFGPVDPPQTGTTPVKTVGVSGGANTGQNTAATSLTITTTNLPVAVVGTDYQTNSGAPASRLMAVGGIGATSWSTTQGTLPAGIMLTNSSGQLSGTVADSPGASDVTFRVNDSLTPTSNFDLEKLTIDVNKFSISSITAANTHSQSIYLSGNPGDSITVTMMVSNEGPVAATSIVPSALTVMPTPGGTTLDAGPAVTCSNPVGPDAIAPNTTQPYLYTCTTSGGNGFVTFSASATAQYVNFANVSVPASAAAATSNQITVDTAPPALVVTSVTVPGAQPNTVQAYTPGTWTNQPVTVTYSCVDNLSGVAAGTPFITVLNPAGPIGTIIVSDPLNATASVTLTAESSNSSVSATCADVAGNSAVPPPAVAPIMIDKTAPQISVAATTPNGAYLANTWTNQTVTVVYTCNDTFSPVNANSGAVSPTYPVVANVPDGAQVTHTQVSPNSATTTVVLTAETAGTTLSASCSDVAANPATALPFGPIMIDKTPPTVIGSATTPNGPYTPGAFTNQPVTVTFACQDTLSGPVPSSIMGNQVISGETNTNVQGSCKDVAGNTGTTSFGPVEVDMIGPAISISSPGPNQVFLLNQPVTPNFSCVEGAGGIDQITSCVSTPPGAFVASPVGPGTFTVNAADQAGNTAQQSTNYLVTYNFIGFQSPLQVAGTAAQPSNSGAFVQGTAIPVQWQLQDFNQAQIVDPTSLVSVQAFPNPACSGPAPGNAVALTLFSNGAPVGATNTFQVNQAGQFVFNWDTTNVAFGCYNVAVTLNDTVSYVTIVDITSVLVNIAPAPGGDDISRGFYLPSYPGSSLSQATLSFSSGTAGTYTFSLTAHAGAYNGPVIGSSQATAVLDGVQTHDIATSFNFPELPIAPGSTVAFVIQQVSGPSNGNVFYSVSTCDFTMSCAIPGPQVIETDGTTPPLDTFRRNGVGLKLLGAQ